MFLDLDRFKPVNDSLGHDIGDLLLREVALRLQACAPRSSDTVSRLGGDEFVILLAQIDKAMDAVVVAGKVLAALGRPFRIGPHQIEISASIGIAVYPQHGDDVHSLLKNADTAMYHAKKAGRNCYRFFPGDQHRGCRLIRQPTCQAAQPITGSGRCRRSPCGLHRVGNG
jgi:diguanylate cyclase (GGDEF)-like protein